MTSWILIDLPAVQVVVPLVIFCATGLRHDL